MSSLTQKLILGFLELHSVIAVNKICQNQYLYPPHHKAPTQKAPRKNSSAVLSVFFFPASAAKAVIDLAAAFAAKPPSDAEVCQLKKYSKISKGL